MAQPDQALSLFEDVPFLNGGLFECLDEQLTDEELARRPELKKLVVQEGKGLVLRIDGFSRRPDAQAKVPNKLFFGYFVVAYFSDFVNDYRQQVFQILGTGSGINAEQTVFGV